MTLSEISIAFNGCNGNVNKSFKEFIIDQELNETDLESGFEVNDSYNYILGDVEKLLDKTLINICASNLLLAKGYFNWGYVTSYYANFFITQGLNRLMLNFTTFNKSTIICSSKNYSQKSLTLKKNNKSNNSHESQFQMYYENFKHFQSLKSIDRYWNIGIRAFKLKDEAHLRNIINYQIEKNIYYELDIDLALFNNIISDNVNYKFDSKKLSISKPQNYSIHNLELALSRLRICTYILNYIANDNNEYKNYLKSRNLKRIKNIKEKYINLDPKVESKIIDWLTFEEIETEQTVSVSF
jgi:hypothetical protein